MTTVQQRIQKFDFTFTLRVLISYFQKYLSLYRHVCSRNGQLLITRPWTRTPNPLMETLVHPPNNRRLEQRWTFDEIH